jgi:catechol 2,3-dioxygenase-like lactoylglutathione lyase family enzyme
MVERIMTQPRTLTAILSCNDLAASEAFYARLGLTCEGRHDGYLILGDGEGLALHLTDAVEGWLVPGRNPFGLYLYAEDVDALAGRVRDLILGGGGPEDKPWGMYEFALSDPDETLVRVGWPTRLRRQAAAD